tara:strand:+ start:249 stop:1160 length:912 start_codon:yes stop_codon:yes gene_type:complete
MKTVVIFGGSGFVGKNIIRRIAKNGYKIIVPHQNPVNEAKLRLLGTTGQVVLFKFQSIKEKKILNILKNADVILNLKTLWDEKKSSYQEGILDFNINLVEIIRNIKKNPQFLFFSGIGVDVNNDSDRSLAIFQSEQYIQKKLVNSIIVRPGVIIGGGDQFLNGLLPLFKISFFIPLFGDGLSKFQPVYIDDISLAINKIISSTLLGNHIFEFVGSEIFTYKDFYNYISECIKKTRVLIKIPYGLAKLGVTILDKISLSPLNTEQLKLFKKDNISSKKYENFDNLDIKPQDLREIIKKFILKNI